MSVSLEVMAKIKRASFTVGQMEALAGIESDEASRRAFWIDCHGEAKKRFSVPAASGEQIMQVARERCHQMTAERVAAGILSMI